MKLSDFLLLSTEEKKRTVLHEGVLVGKRKTLESMIFLFQFDAYYVETFCNARNKSVEEFRVFDGTDSLQPYLDSIPIGHLLA
ncbi:MAG: hypothetical protein JWP27_1023 [Flaviaesturariibacter sp.]|nr:hypothetical protein [Flaviaesturariibacter sp.]